MNVINWGALPELPTRLARFGLDVQYVSAELSRYPDTITLDSLDAAADNIRRDGKAKHYSIQVRGGSGKDKEFSLHVMRGLNIDGDLFQTISLRAPESHEALASTMELLGLEPDVPHVLPPFPPRTVFLVHRFTPEGSEAADKVARFLELLAFSVVTGREFAPKSIAAKVRERLEAQALIVVILTPGEDATWLTQESIVAEVKGKPIIILKEANATFKPGLLADLEYIPFAAPHVESAFVPLIEGLRELGYAFSEV